MIITNVCLLLEALSFVVCLHCLYGEKFRFDIATVCFLSINMIVMTAINYLSLPKVYTLIIYPIIFIYCGVRFGFCVRVLLIKMVLCVTIIGVVQTIILWLFHYFLEVGNFERIDLLLANVLALLVVRYLLPFFKISKIINFLKNKEKIMVFAIGICFVLCVSWLFNYKRMGILEINQALLLLISVILSFILFGQLTKYKVRIKEAETELKMHELYANSFQSLIENIRLRQHEFDNHINTIYSQHFLYRTYEELVDAQKNYCQMITEDNIFNRLLSKGNPIIIGFLYGKFVEIDKMGIEINYKINFKEFDMEIPIYKIIELLGDLINNAVDALVEMEEEKKLYVSVEESDNIFIEVRNESPYIDYSEIANFFTKGYSQKGENRGLGLYNVKQICKEYNMQIVCDNIEVEEKNWISFRIMKNEGTIN